MSTLSENEIVDLMHRNPVEAPPRSGTVAEATIRRLLVIGCGDGGCNITSDIAKALPDEVYTIAYNTSTRTMNGITANCKVYPQGEDGEGRQREDSKATFKQNSYKVLLNYVQEALAKLQDVAYILVVSTADGGTGSGMSPMAAKLIMDNTDVPVIVVGVYPSDGEDATAQFNAIGWQSEIEKVQVPYIILDNNSPDGKLIHSHAEVNAQVTRIASLIAGKEFGNTNISIIDNRNLLMLLNRIGDRIVAGCATLKPTSAQSLDDCVEQLLQTNHQPLPSGVRGIGVFYSGPKDFIDRMDPSLRAIQDRYGNAVLKFAHVVETPSSAGIKVGIILSGCSEPSDRILRMKARYDDIMSSQERSSSVTAQAMSELANPVGRGAAARNPNVQNFSALEL